MRRLPLKNALRRHSPAARISTFSTFSIFPAVFWHWGENPYALRLFKKWVSISIFGTLNRRTAKLGRNFWRAFDYQHFVTCRCTRTRRQRRAGERQCVIPFLLETLLYQIALANPFNVPSLPASPTAYGMMAIWLMPLFLISLTLARHSETVPAMANLSTSQSGMT